MILLIGKVKQREVCWLPFPKRLVVMLNDAEDGEHPHQSRVELVVVESREDATRKPPGIWTCTNSTFCQMGVDKKCNFV